MRDGKRKREERASFSATLCCVARESEYPGEFGRLVYTDGVATIYRRVKILCVQCLTTSRELDDIFALMASEGVVCAFPEYHCCVPLVGRSGLRAQLLQSIILITLGASNYALGEVATSTPGKLPQDITPGRPGLHTSEDLQRLYSDISLSLTTGHYQSGRGYLSGSKYPIHGKSAPPCSETSSLESSPAPSASERRNQRTSATRYGSGKATCRDSMRRRTAQRGGRRRAPSVRRGAWGWTG